MAARVSTLVCDDAILEFYCQCSGTDEPHGLDMVVRALAEEPDYVNGEALELVANCMECGRVTTFARMT